MMIHEDDYLLEIPENSLCPRGVTLTTALVELVAVVVQEVIQAVTETLVDMGEEMVAPDEALGATEALEDPTTLVFLPVETILLHLHPQDRTTLMAAVTHLTLHLQRGTLKPCPSEILSISVGNLARKSPCQLYLNGMAVLPP